MISLRDGMVSLGHWGDRHAIWLILFADRDLWTQRPIIHIVFPRPISWCTYDSGWFGQVYVRLWGWEFTAQMSTPLFWFLFDQLYS